MIKSVRIATNLVEMIQKMMKIKYQRAEMDLDAFTKAAVQHISKESQKSQIKFHFNLIRIAPILIIKNFKAKVKKVHLQAHRDRNRISTFVSYRKITT